jgi:serine protease Do
MQRILRGTAIGWVTVGFAAALGAAPAPAPKSAATVSPPAGADTEELRVVKRASRAFADVAKKATPAVVFIQVEKTIEAGYGGPSSPLNDPFGFFGEDFLERFFGGRGGPRAPRRFRQVGQGTGFLIGKDGYILTNNHVVGDADKITVKLHDGREFAAKRIGSDPRSEVAVIKIEASGLPFIEMGDSTALEIGEWVIAIGNPFGLSATLTVGVVSAKGRSNIGIAEYEDFIQTDAAINPGNSGGPLLNIEGKAIGINTAIFSQSGGYMGIGFAIPIDMARLIKDQFVKHGKVVRGFLGVQLNREDIDDELAQSFGLKKAAGVLVAEVVKDSPAQKAGIQNGDIILRLDGREVQDNSAFRNTVALLPPDNTVRMTVFRDGKEVEIKARVAPFPEDAATDVADQLLEKLGFSVQDLTPDLAARLGCAPGEGVVVDNVAPGGAAANAGLHPGLLIVSLNRSPVASAEAFHKALAEASKNSRALMRVKHARHTWYVLLRLDG